MITGSGKVDAKGNVTLDLTQKDLNNGKTLDHERERGKAKTIDDALLKLGRRFAARDCNKGKPPGPVKATPKHPRRPVHHRGPASSYTASYAGTYSYHFRSDDGGVDQKIALTFNEEVKIAVNRKQEVTATTKSLTAQGTFDSVSFGSGSAHCTLSASGPTPLPLSITPLQKTDAGAISVINVVVRLPDYIAPGDLVIAGDPGCDTTFGTLDPHADDHPDWNEAVASGYSFKTASLPTTKHFAAHDVDPYDNGTDTVIVDATLSVSQPTTPLRAGAAHP